MAPEYLTNREQYAVFNLIHDSKKQDELCLWDIGEGHYYYMSSLDGRTFYDFTDKLKEMVQIKRQAMPRKPDEVSLRGLLYRHGIRYQK